MGFWNIPSLESEVSRKGKTVSFSGPPGIPVAIVRVCGEGRHTEDWEAM